MLSRKGGRGVFFKGHGAFSKIWSGAFLCKSGWVYPCKSNRAYPCKIGLKLPFAKVARHFSKSWAGHSLNTLVGHSSFKKFGQGGF
ncbi:unnamed protein product, partial [Prunus brigantina]